MASRVTYLVSVSTVVVATTIAVALFRRKQAKSKGLLVGDSLAVGLAAPFRDVGLAKDAVAEIGTTVAYWIGPGRSRLTGALVAKPEVVFVSLGTNDAYQGSSYTDTAAKATGELLSLILFWANRVEWIGPPSLPSTYGSKPKSQAVIDAIRAVVETTNRAHWIDNDAVTIPRNADKLHPTADGYSAWAKALAGTQ